MDTKATEAIEPAEATRLRQACAAEDLTLNVVERLVDLNDRSQGRIVRVELGAKPPEEAPLPRSPRRRYGIRDTESFIAFALKYGHQQKSLIFVGEETVTLCIDEQADNDLEAREKEYATLYFQRSELAIRLINSIFGAPFSQEQMVGVLNELEPYITNFDDVYLPIRNIVSEGKITRERKLDSPKGTVVGVRFESSIGGGETAQIPTKAQMLVPLLEDDEGAEPYLCKLYVRLDTIFPLRAEQELQFRLRCQWRSAMKKRIENEVAKIREGLPEWPIMNGSFQ